MRGARQHSYGLQSVCRTSSGRTVRGFAPGPPIWMRIGPHPGPVSAVQGVNRPIGGREHTHCQHIAMPKGVRFARLTTGHPLEASLTLVSCLWPRREAAFKGKHPHAWQGRPPAPFCTLQVILLRRQGRALKWQAASRCQPRLQPPPPLQPGAGNGEQQRPAAACEPRHVRHLAAGLIPTPSALTPARTPSPLAGATKPQLVGVVPNSIGGNT